jgi:putative MATE family efflux protein
MPEQVLGIYSTDPAVVDLGSSYLRIVGLGYMAIAVTFSYSAILRSTGEVKLPMVVSVVALSLNTGLNYGLIFGKFGLPELGVEGAAIATAMARFLECGLMLVLVYHYRLPAAATAREMLDLKLISLKRFFITSIPVILTEVLWSLGITTYNIVYARIGTEAIAAVNISVTIDRVLFVLFIGMSNACAIMIGNRIGANEEWKAFDYAKRFLVLGPALAVLIGLLLVSTASTVLALYNVSAITITYARNILIVMALMLPIRASNLLLLVGILRSGGDTRFAFLIDGLTVWGVGVPLAFTGAFIFGLPVYGVYMLVMTEEILKLIMGLWRLFSRKWIHNLAVPA